MKNVQANPCQRPERLKVMKRAKAVPTRPSRLQETCKGAKM